MRWDALSMMLGRSYTFHAPPALSTMTKRQRAAQPLSRTTRRRRSSTRPQTECGLNQGALKSDLHNRLVQNSDPKYKTYLERYLKGEAPVLGLRLGNIQSTVLEWVSHHGLSQADATETKQLALNLLQLPHEEEKQAGILLMHEVVQKNKQVELNDMTSFARIFDDGYVTTWSVCDSFSSRVLKGLIKQYKEEGVKAICAWRDADNLWRARASVVGLLSLVRDKKGRNVVIEGCEVLMKREERFAKTCVGWALREIAKHDPEDTVRFLESNVRFLTVESVKNATKGLDKVHKESFLKRVKEVQ